MSSERMRIGGFDWWRYFAPTLICSYLTALCVALLVTSWFLPRTQSSLAIGATAIYGLLFSGFVGWLFLRAQRRDLRYHRIPTETHAASYFAPVHAAIVDAGWEIREQHPGVRIEAQTAGTFLQRGERVSVAFVGYEVLVASICDPSVGFSLTGRRKCQAHRDMVRRVVLAGQPAMEL
ncbi:MAG: hypothetical protein ABSE43_04440 [Steroidobacteraceae bacterium]